MDQLREMWLGADYLAVMTYERGDSPYDTRDGLLAFLTDGSPKLRVLYSVVNQICYRENKKLLVTEDTPFCAKFYEDALKAAWVHRRCFIQDCRTNNDKSFSRISTTQSQVSKS